MTNEDQNETVSGSNRHRMRDTMRMYVDEKGRVEPSEEELNECAGDFSHHIAECKQAINEFVWHWLPARTSLGRADRIAGDFLDVIAAEWAKLPG